MADASSVERATIKREATIKEIAHLAGVGVATVDRVIHGRPNVRAEKVERVLKAIDHLNQDRDRRMLQSQGETTHIAVVAHSGRTFLQTMMESARIAADSLARDGISVETHALPDFDPHTIAGTISAAANDADGLVVISPEDPQVHRAIDLAFTDGVPVICVTSDLPATQRLGYVGLNQLHAGRAAAHLMAMIANQRHGDVIISIGNTFRCQAEREMGFRRYLRENCPELSVREIVNVRDDPDVAYQAIKRAFAITPRPLAVYSVSGGNLGIGTALRELDLANPPVFIGHELNHNSRQLLQDGIMHATVDHDTVTEMRWCFEQLRLYKFGKTDPRYFVQQAPRLVMKENMS